MQPNVLRLALDDCFPDPSQPRKQFDQASLEELAASMKRHGQRTPGEVRPATEPGKYWIVAGERRLKALRLAGLPTFLALMADRPMDDAERLEIQCIENCQREDMKPIDAAMAFLRLMEMKGWNAKQLAAAIGKSEATISRTLKLLKLPKEVQERIGKDITAADGYALAAKPTKVKPLKAAYKTPSGLSVSLALPGDSCALEDVLSALDVVVKAVRQAKAQALPAAELSKFLARVK